MRRQWMVVWALIALVSGLFLVPACAQAGPLAEDDPVAQCAEGAELFADGRFEEALPLLEAGFAGREGAAFADSDDLGECALHLGMQRRDTNDLPGALEALAVALEVFQRNGNRLYTGIALYNMAKVYDDQGQHERALEAYKQGLAIVREEDDRASEGRVLYGMGMIYHQQARFAEALDVLQQALAIAREIEDRRDESRALNATGLVYHGRGQYQEAIVAFEQALAIKREIGDRVGEGVSLDGIGTVYYAQGRNGEAKDNFEQVLAITRESGDRAGEATALVSLGSARFSLGENEEALANFEQALAIARETHDREGEGSALNAIGVILDVRGQYDEALANYEQALAIRRELGDRIGECNTLGNIGLAYDSMERYDEALEKHEAVLAISREVGFRAGEATALSRIGLAYHNKRSYDEAEKTYLQALEIQQEIGDRAGQGTTLNNLGEMYRSLARYRDALEIEKWALIIAREVGDRDGEGTILNNMGLVYTRLEQPQEALEAFEQALAIEQGFGRPVDAAGTLNNLGQVYHELGRVEEALAAYEQALEIVRAIGYEAGEATILANLGALYASLGRPDGAMALQESALALGREADSASTMNNTGSLHLEAGRYDEALVAFEQALAIDRETGDRELEGATLNNIGLVYELQDRLDLALATYEEAIAVVEAVRSTAGTEEARAALIAPYVGLYRRTIGLYHRRGQDADAFYTSERGRARAFLDSLATGYVELSDNDAFELLEREQSASAARQAARDALARARAAQPADADLVADLEAQLASAEQEYRAALDAITARGDQLAALVPGRSGVLDLAAVQALLDDRTTLVSYWVLGDQGTLAFVITRDSFTAVELPDATSANLASAVDNTLSWLNREQPSPKPLRDLYAWLVAPLAEHLRTPQVVIVPHKVLHYVPFAALTDGQSYLGQQHLLSVIPSASALAFIQENAAESGATANTHAVVFGNPTTGDPSLPPLAHAASEAQAVAALLGTVAVTSTEASETRLRDQATGSKVLHLAAHGGYNAANPLYSAIYLAPGGAGTAGDGRLETHEVYGLNLKGNALVALSACQTNAGELSAGDELVGLTRAFFFAGTPTTLSSLWEVDDRATEALMTAFYRGWQAGMGKAEALQAAQAEVRANPQWASPFFWAGFVLNGDPGAPIAKVSGAAAQPVESRNSPEPTASTVTPQPGRSLLPVLLAAGAVALGLALLIIGFVRQRRSA